MNITTSKIDAAVDHIDWAIRLLIDHKAYLPSITLAGAAEEVLGKVVGDQSAVFGQLKSQLAAAYSLDEKIVSQQHLNKAKNWLKHNDDRLNSSANFEGDTEAIQQIVRAVTNLIRHDKTVPSEFPRFVEWMKAERPDLL